MEHPSSTGSFEKIMRTLKMAAVFATMLTVANPEVAQAQGPEGKPKTEQSEDIKTVEKITIIDILSYMETYGYDAENHTCVFQFRGTEFFDVSGQPVSPYDKIFSTYGITSTLGNNNMVAIRIPEKVFLDLMSPAVVKKAKEKISADIDGSKDIPENKEEEKKSLIEKIEQLMGLATKIKTSPAGANQKKEGALDPSIGDGDLWKLIDFENLGFSTNPRDGDIPEGSHIVQGTRGPVLVYTPPHLSVEIGMGIRARAGVEAGLEFGVRRIGYSEVQWFPAGTTWSKYIEWEDSQVRWSNVSGNQDATDAQNQSRVNHAEREREFLTLMTMIQEYNENFVASTTTQQKINFLASSPETSPALTTMAPEAQRVTGDKNAELAQLIKESWPEFRRVFQSQILEELNTFLENRERDRGVFFLMHDGPVPVDIPENNRKW